MTTPDDNSEHIHNEPLLAPEDAFMKYDHKLRDTAELDFLINDDHKIDLTYTNYYVSPEEFKAYKYQSDRRNDPELKAKVRKVLIARQEAVREAAALLARASQILKEHAHYEDGVIYNRQAANVSSASHSLNSDGKFLFGTSATGNPADSDTFLGNLAAGPLGEQIQKMGDRFPL